MHNIGEHIDEYQVDDPRRRDHSIRRQMLEISAWNEQEYHWLGAVLNATTAHAAGKDLFSQICRIHDRYRAPSS